MGVSGAGSAHQPEPNRGANLPAVHPFALRRPACPPSPGRLPCRHDPSTATRHAMTRDGSFAPVPLDGGARAFAQSLAERWRATGLGVSLDLPADGARPGEHYYVLTARTPSRVLACT